MKIHEVNISAGFTNRIKSHTDDLMAIISGGEVKFTLEDIDIHPEEVEQVKKVMDLIHTINGLINQHNRSL